MTDITARYWARVDEETAVNRLLNDWRATGQVSYHLMRAMHGSKNSERLVDRAIFGDHWTREEACGDLYEILYRYARTQVRRQAAIEAAADHACEIPF